MPASIAPWLQPTTTSNVRVRCIQLLSPNSFITAVFIVRIAFCTKFSHFLFSGPVPLADHHDELFYICLLFGVVVLILLSSILVVIGRIVLNKRRVNMAAKMQTSETGTTAIPAECTETISDDMDIDLTAPATIPSISRNNVRI